MQGEDAAGGKGVRMRRCGCSRAVLRGLAFVAVGVLIGWLGCHWTTQQCVEPAGPAERCSIQDPGLRMHRLGMIFNERGRTTTTIESLSTTKNAAVAFQLTQADAALAAAHGRIDWTRADVWEDLNLGTQYLVEGLDSSQRTVLVTVADDRRHQVSVVEDPPYSGRVTIIMALWNRAAQLSKWAVAMQSMRAEDKDPRRTRLCVADFASDDIDVEATLQSTRFAFALIRMPGPFSKTHALNACLGTVSDVNEVVFTTDVDVVLPADFADRIRRFARPGRRVYAPIAWYEDCEWRTPSGECWGDGGYGLVAYGAGDARQIGGYDERRFNYREGFEDTDFLLRLLRLPRTIVRRRERDFVHLWHPPSAWASQSNDGEYKQVALPPVC